MTLLCLTGHYATEHAILHQLILVLNLLLGPFMNLIFLKFREIRQRQLFYERFTLILFLIFSFFPAILYFDRAHVGDTWARYRCWVPCPPRAGQFEHKHTLWWLTRPARKLTPAQSHAELFATRNLFREELGLVRSCLSRAFPFWQNLTLVLLTSTMMHIENLIVTQRKIYHWSSSEIRNNARSI